MKLPGGGPAVFESRRQRRRLTGQVMKAIIILTTTGDADLARRIAVALVESGEAACANILPGVRSIYSWEGKVCDEGEHLIVIKTAAEKFEQVRSRILSLHSYQVPEVLAIPVTAGDPDYLAWLKSSLKP